MERAALDQVILSILDYAEKMTKDGAWGGFTEIAAFAPKFECIAEVYSKPDGNFKQLFEFGPEGPGVVRLAFTGGDHYRYLAAAADFVLVGQGPSPEPPGSQPR